MSKAGGRLLKAAREAAAIARGESDFRWVRGEKEDPCDAAALLPCWRMECLRDGVWTRTPYWSPSAEMPTKDARIMQDYG